jgi:hypothetical protein
MLVRTKLDLVGNRDTPTPSTRRRQGFPARGRQGAARRQSSTPKTTELLTLISYQGGDPAVADDVVDLLGDRLVAQRRQEGESLEEPEEEQHRVPLIPRVHHVGLTAAQKYKQITKNVTTAASSNCERLHPTR